VAFILICRNCFASSRSHFSRCHATLEALISLQAGNARISYRDGNIKFVVARLEFPSEAQRCVRGILVAREKDVILRRIYAGLTGRAVRLDVTIIEEWMTLINPANEQVSTVDGAVTRESKSNVTSRPNLHFKSDVRIEDRPQQPIILVQVNLMVPLKVNGCDDVEREQQQHQETHCVRLRHDLICCWCRLPAKLCCLSSAASIHGSYGSPNSNNDNKKKEKSFISKV